MSDFSVAPVGYMVFEVYYSYLLRRGNGVPQSVQCLYLPYVYQTDMRYSTKQKKRSSLRRQCLQAELTYYKSKV